MTNLASDVVTLRSMVARLNIELFCKILAEEMNETKRQTLLQLVAEERAKLSGLSAAVQMAAATLGLQVSAASAVSAEEIKHAIEKLEGDPDRGVIVLPTPCHDYKPQPHHRVVGSLSAAGDL